MGSAQKLNMTFSQHTFQPSEKHPVSNTHTFTQSWVPELEHFAAPVVCPLTDEMNPGSKNLSANNITRKVWMTAFRKEFGTLVQGDDNTKTVGTDLIFILTYKQINKVPREWFITYARIVVDYQPQKKIRIAFISELEESYSHILMKA